VKFRCAGMLRLTESGVRPSLPPKREGSETPLRQSALLIAFERELAGKEGPRMSRHDFGVSAHDDPNEGKTWGSDG
jgi:hypothetical protein